MARLFVRLKLRLTRNRLRRAGTLGVLGFVLIWLAAAAAGALLGLLTYGAGYLWGSDGVALAFALVGLGWLFIPVVAAALDETIDPRRLELLPLGTRRLAVGLLAAAAIGPGTVVTVMAALGAAMWSIHSLGSVLPVLVTGLAFVIWCLASSRLVTTFLTDLLRSRRGRDVAVVGVSLLVGTIAIFANIYRPDTRGSVGNLLEPSELGRLLVWTPPGAAGIAMNLFGDGEYASALLRLGYLVLTTAIVVWMWQMILARLTTRSLAPARVRTVGDGDSIIPGVLEGRSGAVVATAAKELLYMRRDPRFRSQAVGLVIALGALGFGVGRFLLGTEYAPFLATVVAWMVASTGFNLFGMDDRSFWGYLVSGVDLKQVLAGKNLALALIGIPAVGVVVVLVALAVGDFSHFLSALIAALAILAVWLGAGNVTSVLGAFPMPESNLFGSRNASMSAGLVAIVGV
ncbi:MAG: hypothetical protein ACRDWH_07940, partial [Acidimicrobiia bacterium]